MRILRLAELASGSHSSTGSPTYLLSLSARLAPKWQMGTDWLGFGSYQDKEGILLQVPLFFQNHTSCFDIFMNLSEQFIHASKALFGA